MRGSSDITLSWTASDWIEGTHIRCKMGSTRRKHWQMYVSKGGRQLGEYDMDAIAQYNYELSSAEYL